MKKPAMILAVFLAAPAMAQSPASQLKLAADESLALIVPAKGVQIYECRAQQWVFVAPDAELFDTKGTKIGRHYAGPHWEATDGSKLLATVKARADAPEAGAIPWLLLRAQSVGRKGAFSEVSSIRRVNTVGGLAPSQSCSEEGKVVRVPYTADYHFFSWH